VRRKGAGATRQEDGQKGENKPRRAEESVSCVHEKEGRPTASIQSHVIALVAETLVPNTPPHFVSTSAAISLLLSGQVGHSSSFILGQRESRARRERAPKVDRLD
jgi:hypothetical protein